MDGRKPRDTAPNARPARPAATSPPDEAWLFAQDVLGKSVSPPDEVWSFAQAVLGKPVPVLDEPFTESTAEHDLRQWSSEIATLHEGSWDPVKHPHGGFSLNRGWFSLTGGAGGATTPRLGCTPWSLQATVPMTTPWNPALPLGRGHAGAAVGPAARVAAGGLLGGLSNASMGAYWSRVPGAQAMPAIWQHELDKRVRAGTLSRANATGIFNTALLGAQAQRFAPTGGTMSAVHQSATDFMGKAESVYWAKKADRQGSAARKPGAKSADPVATEATPTTDLSQFRPVRGANAKVHVVTGEIWSEDKFHKNHYEVYKNKKMFDNDKRDRSVREDGRLKEQL